MTASATPGADPFAAWPADPSDADEVVVPPEPPPPAPPVREPEPEPTPEPEPDPEAALLPGLPPAEVVPRGWMPRQVGGIWFGLGVAIGWVGGVLLQHLSMEGIGLPMDQVLLLVLGAGIVLTCIRRTCSFGLGALVSVPFAPILITGQLVAFLAPWLGLLG